jgi:poly(3-hydroxybutyrate) depolymerase
MTQYQAYQAYSDMMAPMHWFTRAAVTALSHSWLMTYPGIRHLAATYEVLSSANIMHTRSDFGLTHIRVGDNANTGEVAVYQETAYVAPFGTLLHFRKEGVAGQPRVLIVAPMSGHFASRLREMTRTMLQDHDVYITDWHNARDVPLAAGRFGLDDYVQYLIKFLEAMGPGSHIVAVCQSCVAALVASAIMAEDNSPAQPRSLTLMAGPIDARINPTEVNKFATRSSIEWLEKNLIDTVPSCHSGAMRRVYPGFLQLMTSMSMKPAWHVTFFKELYNSLIEGNLEKANATRMFYEEYFAVMDLTAEFYLETTRDVFQEYALPLGKFEWYGRLVNPAAIRRTALLTVEGKHDNVCGIGQTMAAHALCSRSRPKLKSHHMQIGAGHEGVFSGQGWTEQVYPSVRKMIRISQ